eukprot:g37080.t1
MHALIQCTAPSPPLAEALRIAQSFHCCGCRTATLKLPPIWEVSHLRRIWEVPRRLRRSSHPRDQHRPYPRLSDKESCGKIP